MTMPSFHAEWAPQIPCPGCDAKNLLLSDELQTYLWDKAVPCVYCGVGIDLFTVLRDYLALQAQPEIAMAIVGAHVPFFKIPLVAGKSVTVDFTDYGVPADADILAVFSGKRQISDIRTVAPHIILPDRFPIDPPRHLSLTGYAVNDGVSDELSMAVVWMPHGEHTPQRQLVNAMSAFVSERYMDSIIPANTSVEAAIAPIVREGLARYAGRDRVNGLLDVAGYSHQLNVLLPVVAAVTRVPPLHDSVRGLLNRLNKLRNDRAHGAAVQSPLTKQEAAELLTAALLGVAYGEMVSPVLIDGKKPRRPRLDRYR